MKPNTLKLTWTIALFALATLSAQAFSILPRGGG
jgi:hypothetical protein